MKILTVVGKNGVEFPMTEELYEKYKRIVKVVAEPIKPSPETPSLSDKGYQELKDMADEKGIEYSGNVSKVKLIELLEA